MCKILVTLNRLARDEDLCKRMTGKNLVSEYLWNFDGVIDRPQVDCEGIPVCAYLLLLVCVLHHQSLFLQDVNF